MHSQVLGIIVNTFFSVTVSSRTGVLEGYYKSSGVVPAFVPAPCRRRCPIPFFIDTSQLILLCICARSVPPPVPDPTADSGRRRQTAADGSRQRQTAADGGRRRQMAADGGSHFHRHLSAYIDILLPQTVCNNLVWIVFSRGVRSVFDPIFIDTSQLILTF